LGSEKKPGCSVDCPTQLYRDFINYFGDGNLKLNYDSRHRWEKSLSRLTRFEFGGWFFLFSLELEMKMESVLIDVCCGICPSPSPSILQQSPTKKKCSGTGTQKASICVLAFAKIPWNSRTPGLFVVHVPFRGVQLFITLKGA